MCMFVRVVVGEECLKHGQENGSRKELWRLWTWNGRRKQTGSSSCYYLPWTSTKSRVISMSVIAQCIFLYHFYWEQNRKWWDAVYYKAGLEISESSYPWFLLPSSTDWQLLPVGVRTLPAPFLSLSQCGCTAANKIPNTRLNLKFR